VLKSGDLASFDVVVLDHLMHDYSPAEVEIFKTWLQGGKGVVSMTGYLNSTSVDLRANVFLAPLGVSYVSSHYLNGPIGNFAQHPITRGLTSVTFLGGYLVSEIDNPGGATRTLLGTIPDGNAAYAVELGQARAFVWGDEWIEFDSEWTTLPEIKQLWVQVFEWLAPTRCKLKPPA
jgi:hypothetical protein